MRRERMANPIRLETKLEAQWLQVDRSQKLASSINFDRLSTKALDAYQRIVMERKTGTDVSSSEFKMSHKELIEDATPVLEFGLNEGYISKVFNQLRYKIALNEPKSSFSLMDLEGSPDGISFEMNKPHLEVFDDCPQAHIVAESWDKIEAIDIILEALQDLKKPILLPQLRRDMAARTGRLGDYAGYLGGARLIIPTKIYGVVVENDYETGEAEFPDLRIVVSKLS